MRSSHERFHPQSPDFSVQYNYIENFLDLPWGEYTKDNLNLANAEKVLNKDHYGMEKVKERILEHLAVLKMRGDFKTPIICLYGPPGVGKTSLGKSIAAALNRKYVRVSFGGLHDEAEIRGHRRTYIGAMPGRIITAMKQAGSKNPLILLDEAAAHLDSNARNKLFEELGAAHAQVWATGLDINVFKDVPDATFVTCMDGQINNILGAEK